MSVNDPALSLEGLSKRYGKIQAVDHLTLQVNAGQMAGFLGLNGAGKSTTLFMIPRLVQPSEGTIRIFGMDVSTHFKQAMSSVGIVVETASFYEYLSGRLNLELTARLLRGISKKDIDEILERVGLATRQHDCVRTYSLGMKQRLGIGRAMLGHPRLLILDEPTNGLDPEGTQEILSFLRDKVQQDGITVFLSSHLMSEIEEYCDSVFVIHQGRLAASGNVKDILKPHQRVVRITFDGNVPELSTLSNLNLVQHVDKLSAGTLEVTLAQDESAWLNQHLHQSGYRISSMIPKQKTLKEFFLGITGAREHE